MFYQVLKFKEKKRIFAPVEGVNFFLLRSRSLLLLQPKAGSTGKYLVPRGPGSTPPMPHSPGQRVWTLGNRGHRLVGPTRQHHDPLPI